MNLGWFPLMSDISPEYKQFLLEHGINAKSKFSELHITQQIQISGRMK